MLSREQQIETSARRVDGHVILLIAALRAGSSRCAARRHDNERNNGARRNGKHEHQYRLVNVKQPITNGIGR